MKQKLKFIPGVKIRAGQQCGGMEKMPELVLADGSRIHLSGYDAACGPRQHKRRERDLPTLQTRNELGQLFAAAPDLLAALTECSLNLAKQIRTTNHNALGFNSLVDLQGQVLAALLKAKEAQ